MGRDVLDETTKRRLRAGRMLLAGRDVAEVALVIGVARQTVYTWKGRLDKGGIDALRTMPRSGRPSRLNKAQLAGLRRALLQNPTEHGLGTQRWTLERVRLLIKRMYAVEYGQTQVWNILGALGFSVQKQSCPTRFEPGEAGVIPARNEPGAGNDDSLAEWQQTRAAGRSSSGDGDRYERSTSEHRREDAAGSGGHAGSRIQAGGG